jgi:hypothetical protein
MRLPKQSDMVNNYPYFYFDKRGFYVEATSFILTGKNIESIFFFLVSDIGFYTFSRFYSGPQFDVTGFRYKKEYLSNLYIPNMSPDNNKKLLSYFSNNFNNTENSVEKLFIDTIGLDKDELSVIKGYKSSLLNQKKG